jgi:hypothetical protein
MAALLMTSLLAPTGGAWAQAESEDDDAEEEVATPRKKGKAPKASRPKSTPRVEVEKEPKEPGEEGGISDFSLDDLDLSFLTKKPSRYGFLGAGVFAVGGAGFIYLAQGEAKRAETTAVAREANRNLQAARASSAMANVLLGLAVLSAGYALVMEALPTQKRTRVPSPFTSRSWTPC